MTGWRAALIALAGLGAAVSAAAAEMLVQGEVIDVVPVAAGGRAVANDCHPPRPRPEDGLVALLGWDLRASCRAAANAYRVYYRWDGRTYSRLMPEPPGDTVPLRVRVE
ncbi:MAG TPA: hypothetical protein VF210_11020 [Pseudomonadales bacterium]